MTALLIGAATLAALAVACSQPAEPGQLPSGSAPTTEQEISLPTTTAATTTAATPTPTVPTPTRQAEPPQTLDDHSTERVIVLPPTTAAATLTPTVPTPTPPQDTTKASPPPAPTGHPEMTPEVTAANDSIAPFVQVSAGPFHTCGLRADGTITCWGAHGEDERLTEAAGLLDSPPGRYSRIDAGHHHSCAIRQDGAVKCWGSMSIEGDDMPTDAKAMMEAMWAPPEGRFISVSAGFLFSCGVRDDNTAECWGLLASLSDALTPPTGEYTAVSVGGFHACGIRTDQTAVCWGSDLGFDGDFLGQATPPDGPFEVINAGGYHTCGFRPDGEIRCWGSIVGGYHQTCEPQPDGTNRCWTDERAKKANQAWGGDPDSAPDGDLKAIDSGQVFSCALWDGGYIGCWGSGGINDSPPPGIFEAVTVGEDHGCGLRPDGSIECWGDDRFGRASPPGN